MLLSRLLCSIISLLPLGVYAALDDDAKMGNRTIERVSSDAVRQRAEDTQERAPSRSRYVVTFAWD